MTPKPPGKIEPCTGSGLTNDPSGHQCFTPASPAQGCPQPMITQTPLAKLSSPDTFDAEISTAIDPRGNGVAYAVTIQGETLPETGTTSGVCIVKKHIALYKLGQDDPNDPNRGPHWFPMPGSETIPHNPDDFATDPSISVGVDGTLYLTFLRIRSLFNRTDGTLANLTPCARGVNDVESAIELWVAPPVPSDLTRSLPLQLAPLSAATAGTTTFTQPSNALVGKTSGADAPKLAASRTVPGLVFITGSGGGPDFLAALQRDPTTGVFDQKARFAIQGARTCPVVTVDDAGSIYVILDILDDSSPLARKSLAVRKFSFDGSTLTQVLQGAPPSLESQGITYMGASSIDATPAGVHIVIGAQTIAVARLGNSSDNIVYVAFDVDTPDGRKIEITAANSRDLTQWTAPVFSQPGFMNSFRPTLSVDGPSNLLSLAHYAFDTSHGVTPSTLLLNKIYTRFDAGSLAVVAGPILFGSTTVPVPTDLPQRHGPIDNPNSDYDRTSVFVCEYTGLSSSGLTAVAGFPDLTSPRNTDLSIAQISTSCGQAVILGNYDSSWECDCSCGTNSVTTVGCAPAGSTASSVCGPICSSTSPCGAKLTCSGTAASCTSLGAGRLVATNGCLMSDGPQLNSPPVNNADFSFATTAASTATVTLAGQPTTTRLLGSVYFNATTSPPTPGAIAEIAWLKVQPESFFLGGPVGTFITNIRLTHPKRLLGTFTDATHFTIAPGAAEFVLSLQTEPVEGEVSDQISFRAANPSPMTGTVNLQAGTFTLDGTAGDGSGNSLTMHVDSTITSRPPDSDHDGIIDAVDKCPGATVGPDRTPPRFTFVPADITTTTCTGVSLGQAVATDPCGVTVTNNAPSKFPLGTTLVTWTARDGAGNVARATQAVTAVLGNSTSCCPAGSKIIVGTSNNDVLTGTSGKDCILGLGGQDTINGGGGDDVINGGDGDDIINGGDGNDRLYGGSGQDQISGGAGNDIIDGGDGDDRINGDDGDDIISGGQGQDICFGGLGNDIIDGGTGDDQLHGGDGNDRVSGGADNDRLFGENGDDVVSGGVGDDIIDGGSGQNLLSGGGGHDTCIDLNMTLPECPEPGGD